MTERDEAALPAGADNDFDDEDDDFEDDDEDDDEDEDDDDEGDDEGADEGDDEGADGRDEDEIAGEGNRVVGARAVAVVEHVARALAEDPDAVDIEVRERRDGVELLIHAGPGDAGRIIGKRGRVIQALRQVARAAGAAEGARTSVDVAD